MNDEQMKRPVEWADRVNRRWIVHHGLGERAGEWMNYLSETDPDRLKISCENARSMIRLWDETGDPKPWFYSGLFHNATESEARRFLAGHRLTTATVLSMADDEDVRRWEAALCTETRALVVKLKTCLRSIRKSAKAGE